MSNVFDVSGKVVFITGATGGIGKAVAKKLHSEGAIIVATDLNQILLDELVAELTDERIMALVLDVTDTKGLATARQVILDQYGQIDMVFANAGIACDPPQTVATMPTEIFEKIIEVDLLGVTRTVKTFLNDVIRSEGHILVTASIYAYLNGFLNAPYAVSKAGVEMYGRALRAEISGTGATVGVLYPGWVDTNIAKNALGGDEKASYLVKRYYKGPFGKAVSADFIAKEVSKGIKKRKPRIHAPARWAPLSAFRGLLSQFTDWAIDRDKKAQSVLKTIEKRDI